MWQFVRKPAHSQDELAGTMQELLAATIRRLLLISTLYGLVCALLFTSQWTGSRIAGLMVGLLLTALLVVLAYWLLKRYILLALLTWLAALVLAIGWACWLTQNPRFLMLGIVLPLVAVITVGGWAGVLVELGLIFLTAAAMQSLFGAPLPLNEALFVIVVGAFCGLLGWAARAELVTVAEWSIASYAAAQRNLDNVRDHRLELAQSREELLQANRELTRMSSRLKTLERIAEEARQAKTEFVANVSHELRTPLNMIIGFADVISYSPQVYGRSLPPALMTDIAAIRRNADHLASLVNDVLDLSQVEAGRMALSREWVAPVPMLEEAVSVVKGFFSARGLYLRLEIFPDPTTAPLPPIFCDATRIRQVVINLLGNAGRFTEQGGVLLQCRTIEQPAPHELLISVADTGPGIAEEDQQRIFEPFQQADVSTRRRHGGSGLGLTISKQFVEMHGGRMWLQSRLGVGTTIFFTLPLEQPSPALLPDDDHRLRRAISPDDEVGYHLRTNRTPAPALTERFVVLDDEQMLPRLLARYMPQVDVELAPDAAGAIASLRRSPAQALLVNAPPFAQLPAEVFGNLPFVTPVISCWLPGEHAAAQRLGVVEYLIKPISREKLLAALARLQPAVKTVLVVDDEEDELQLFARMLASHEPRYSILQVTTGQRALSMLRSRQPDVMLLDLMMPAMNGFQVLAEKARDPAIAAIPTLIISSRDPAGEPLIGNSLAVTQGSGLTQRHLIACIQAIGAILAPSVAKENTIA